uniref:Glycosyltransferase family 92 protein n=1 Tax=Caenorhabditis tropicalis TaxID=1561998 RepID=A0A1I7U2P6_9PELO
MKHHDVKYSPLGYPKPSGDTRGTVKKRIFLISLVIAIIFLLYTSTNLSNPSNPSPDSDDLLDFEPTTSTLPTPLPNFTNPIAIYHNGTKADLLLTEDSDRLTKILPVSHVFIASAYYYPYSKSLGRNAVAINMVVDSKNFLVDHSTYNFIGSNSTHSEHSVAISQSEAIKMCRYAPVVARGNSVDGMSKLEMESDGQKVQIPFKMARYTAPKPVIICISPQFVAEQWQIFLMHVHVANRFGAHMHIYIISIVNAFFELMKEYERMGYITMEKWVKMKIANSETPYFEMNLNTELRNQAGALSDCLLQYKEAADFIAFFDMDDVLVPLNYPTYLEEFTAEWGLQTNATSLIYGRREHEFVKAERLSEFSFHELVASLRSSLTKAGKSVVKPHLHNSTWIHASHRENQTTRRQVASPRLIHVQRPVQKHGSNEIKALWKFDFKAFNETIREEDIQAIEEDIWRVRNISIIAEIGKRLPSVDYYFPIVFKCYLDQFYGRALTECPNAEKCSLPQRDDYKCIHTDAQYFSGPTMKPFTYHFSNHAVWSKNYGCYQ